MLKIRTSDKRHYLVLSAVHFRNFRALRDTRLELGSFNLLIGPNGSGKTSLIDAILRLRSLARLNASPPTALGSVLPDSPRICFEFSASYSGLRAELGCESDFACDLLAVRPGGSNDTILTEWSQLRDLLSATRCYAFNHRAMAESSGSSDDATLREDGANLASVLEGLSRSTPVAFSRIGDTVCKLFPEYAGLEIVRRGKRGTVALRLAASDTLVTADNLSQGTLYGLAFATLAHAPTRPALVMFEEIDRGLHPRLFRRLTDLLHNLSHPTQDGGGLPATQIIATTHSPYVMDQFRDHPEEIVISSKRGEFAAFERLSERPDLDEILRESAAIGELWYSGILGGVPEEGTRGG